jgi:peptide/nickel transport system ATP-binding protein/oligopeptide transport system ATP-binding protein
VIFRRSAGAVRAVDDISFHIAPGETLGLVGETGCGKTTAARLCVRLIEPTFGSIRFDGEEISGASGARLKALRREMQVVFQDPYSSLNPRRTVGSIIADPLAIHGTVDDAGQRRTRVQELMDQVGLSPEHYNRYPQQFSGGQRQRIGIARALALRPRLIVLDEPVSALDVSIQAQVINLLGELQRELGLSYLLVAHDLSVVRHASDRIAVMYLGKLMEVGPAKALFDRPVHPYTLSLYSAVPVADPAEGRTRERIVLRGDPPSPADPPSGCRFHTRCPWATEVCREIEPPLVRYPDGRIAACHHPRNVTHDEVRAATRSDASPLSAGDELPGEVYV